MVVYSLLTLYETFSQQYYCPTGLEVPALSYEGCDGEQVKMLIIGDPTSLGALINDGIEGRPDGQLQLDGLGQRASTISCMLSRLTPMLLFSCSL